MIHPVKTEWVRANEMIAGNLMVKIQNLASAHDLHPTYKEIFSYCCSVASAIEGGEARWLDPQPGEVVVTPIDVADWLITDEIGIRASFYRWLKRKQATQER